MITDRLGKELLFFDGGMGTLLQERGLKPGELPETWNIERRKYLTSTDSILRRAAILCLPIPLGRMR